MKFVQYVAKTSSSCAVYLLEFSDSLLEIIKAGRRCNLKVRVVVVARNGLADSFFNQLRVVEKDADSETLFAESLNHGAHGGAVIARIFVSDATADETAFVGQPHIA